MEPEEVILEELDRMMDEFMDTVMRYSQERLIEDGKIDTGMLFKTANIERSFLSKTLVFPASYADFVEYGRNPGTMPPPAALYNWVRRKLGIKGEKEIMNVAYAIAVAIKQRGIDPSPYLRPSIDRARAEYNV